jgi:hypothetical protein
LLSGTPDVWERVGADPRRRVDWKQGECNVTIALTPGFDGPRGGEAMAEPGRNESEEETEVKVTDRRLFTPDGRLRGDLPEGGETRAEEPAPARPVAEPAGVDFTMLINAMAEPALLFLGEISYPGADRPEVDLERARIQIDMLDLLRVKCRGNLAPGEEALLERILYQLRMLYVARADQPASR